MNQDVIDMANVAVNSLFVLLDTRRAANLIITHRHYNGSDRVHEEAVSNLGMISEVVDAYNQLVSIYLSNNTTQTMGIILSSIRSMLGFMSEIRRGLFNTIRRYAGFDTRDRQLTTYIKNYLFDLVVAFVP